MNNNDISVVLSKVNLPIVYACAVILTLLVIGRRYRLFDIPRLVALSSWYVVVVAACGWLLFHLLYLATGDKRDVGLASLVHVLTFVPVYLCALVLAFYYPGKPALDGLD